VILSAAAAIAACGQAEEPSDQADSGAIDAGLDAQPSDLGTAVDSSAAADSSASEDGGTADSATSSQDIAVACPTACTETAPRCVNGRPHACEDTDADGCKEWTAKPVCKVGQVCENGVCTALHCGPGTELVDGVCVAVGCPNKQIRIDGKCVDNPCGDGTKWRDGKCRAPCPKGCTVGAKRCENGWPQTCQAIGADSCAGWVTGSGCGFWSFCHAGACITGDQALFEPVPGNGVVSATGIALSTADPRVAYAGSDLAGVSTTGDGGATWHAANEGLWRGGSQAVAALDVHPKNPRHALAAVGGTSDEAGATYRTYNGGLTWAKTSGLSCFQASGPDRVAGALFARDPANPNLVYLAASRCGVLRSTNGGSSWGVMGFVGRLVASVVPDPNKKGSFVAAVLDDPNTGAKGGIWTGINNKWTKRSGLSVRALGWWKGAWYAGSSRGIEILDDKWQAKPFWPAKPCVGKNAFSPDVRSIAVEWDGLLVGAAALPAKATSCVTGGVTGGIFKIGASASLLQAASVHHVVAHGKTALAATDNGVWRRDNGTWKLGAGTSSNWLAVDTTGGKLRGGGGSGAVTTVGTKSVSGGKPCDGIVLAGRCHKALKSTATFTAAEATCKAWGGHLVSPRGASEVAALRSYATSVCGNIDLWIGLNDAKKEGEFVWTDGSDNAWAPWLNNEPNDYGTAGEDFTQLRRDRHYNDISPTATQGCMVCSRAAPNVHTLSSDSVAANLSGCPDLHVTAVAGNHVAVAGTGPGCNAILRNEKKGYAVVFTSTGPIRALLGSVTHSAKPSQKTAPTAIFSHGANGKSGFVGVLAKPVVSGPALDVKTLPLGDPVLSTFDWQTVTAHVLSGNTWQTLAAKTITDATKNLHKAGMPEGAARFRWSAKLSTAPLAVSGWHLGNAHLIVRWAPSASWKKTPVPAQDRRITALAMDAKASTMLAIVAATKTSAATYFALKKGGEQWNPVSRQPVHGACSMLKALPGGDFIAYGRHCVPSWVRLL